MEPQNSTPPEVNNQETPQVKTSSSLTTVTPLSKYLAMALFVILPFVGFWLGMRYGASLMKLGLETQMEVSSEETSATEEEQPDVTERTYVSFEIEGGSTKEGQALYGVTADGEKQLLVQDLAIIIPRLDHFRTLETDTYAEIITAYPERGEVLVGVSIYASHGEGGSLYKYSVEENVARVMDTAYLIGYPDQEKFSPSGRYYAELTEYDVRVVDLYEDRLLKRISAGQGEQFIGNCTVSCTFDITWLNDTSFEYGVWDSSHGTSDAYPAVLLETREFTI